MRIGLRKGCKKCTNHRMLFLCEVFAKTLWMVNGETINERGFCLAPLERITVENIVSVIERFIKAMQRPANCTDAQMHFCNCCKGTFCCCFAKDVYGFSQFCNLGRN